MRATIVVAAGQEATLKYAGRTAIAITSLALTLSACGGTPERDSSAQDSLETTIDLADNIDKDAHFSWAYTQYTTSWDPTKSVGGGDMSFYYPVYDRLLQLAPDATVEPLLAEEFTSEGNTVTLTLREGLVFSDGTPFDAEAVKFNLERGAAQGSTLVAEVGQMESVEVIDPLTVEVTVSSGLGAYLTALTARGGIMISPAAVQSGAIDSGPAGIGPYVATSMAAGDRVEYERTPDYWDPDAQNVATMTYILMLDDQTRYNALLSGEVDGAYLNPNQINAAVNSEMQVVSEPSTSFVYFMVNPTVAPFDDPKVREALNYAVDRQGIAEGLYSGHCSAGIQPWPTSSPAYSEEIGDGLDIWPHDPEKAKELLTEAGYPDGFEFTSLTTNITQYQNLSEAIQEQLAEAGITMTIDPVPTPQVIEKFVVNQEVEGNINPYTGLADPHGVIARSFLAGGTYGFGGQMPAETVELVNEAAGPVDPQERRPLYEQVMQEMIDTPTHMLALCQVHLTSAFQPAVSNVIQHYSGVPTLRGVAVSED